MLLIAEGMNGDSAAMEYRYRRQLQQHFRAGDGRVSNRLARRTWWGLDDQQSRSPHGTTHPRPISNRPPHEGLSQTCCFSTDFERYGLRLLPYLLLNPLLAPDEELNSPPERCCFRERRVQPDPGSRQCR